MAHDTLQETGHLTMLDRVKAAHRMVMAMVDSWELRTQEQPPKWVSKPADRTFYAQMLGQFDMMEMEKISISKAQFWYLRDLYERSL